MSSSKKLRSVFEKYKTHPEFIGLALTDPNQRGAIDDTVLHVAARSGDIDGMVILVDSGAEVNAVGDLGNTPLHQAAMMGQVESVRFLLTCDAKRQLQNEFSQTPLDIAEIGGHKDIVNLLSNEE